MFTAVRLTVALALLVASGAPAARLVTVHPGESIQTALDATAPGTTIVVLSGVCHESGPTRALTVTQDGIRLLARPRPGEPVVIEPSGGQTQGIWVSPADTLDPPDDDHDGGADAVDHLDDIGDELVVRHRQSLTDFSPAAALTATGRASSTSRLAPGCLVWTVLTSRAHATTTCRQGGC
jgi:hypothetical protein